MSFNDMVLDKNGNPAVCNTPSYCKRWLKYNAKLDSSIYKYTVRIGKTMKTVSVKEYLK